MVSDVQCTKYNGRSMARSMFESSPIGEYAMQQHSRNLWRVCHGWWVWFLKSPGSTDRSKKTGSLEIGQKRKIGSRDMYIFKRLPNWIHHTIGN